jgi:1-acyl-sn-glycerol-3-phosphate acyltransferase
LKRFYDGAFRVAIETQTSIKPFLLLDAYDRMSYKNLFSLTPGKSRSVFLEEIPVEGLTLKDVSSLRQKVYAIMDAKLREHKATWISSQTRLS